jgi:hypothetical protein
MKKKIGQEFEAVEVALSRTFSPALFGDDYDNEDPRRNVSCLPEKWIYMAVAKLHSRS